MPGMDERFELRFDREMLDAVDRWRAEQRGIPSRAQAIRQLIEKGLQSDHSPAQAFSPSGTERLMLAMLAEIHQQLDIHRDLDPEFVSAALWGGHDWAMRWQFDGL